MVLDTALLNTQEYKVRIKGKVEQSRERSSALYTEVAFEKGAFWSLSTTVANFTYVSPTPLCSSYWKGSLLVTPDYYYYVL